MTERLNPFIAVDVLARAGDAMLFAGTSRDVRGDVLLVFVEPHDVAGSYVSRARVYEALARKQATLGARERALYRDADRHARHIERAERDVAARWHHRQALALRALSNESWAHALVWLLAALR